MDWKKYKPCDATFEEMAKTDLAKLAQWINSGELDNAWLSFAAEYYGKYCDITEVGTLFPLLQHSSPVVREGVLCGLEGHVGDPTVRQQVEEVKQSDSSQIISEIAADILEQS